MLLTWLILLALLMAPGAPSWAQNDRPVIASASEIDYPPFCVVDDQGRPDGFSVELLRAALTAMGRDVTFRTGTWPEVRGMLEQGEVDALPLVGRTPEREPLFDFTVPYMSLHGAIVVRQDNTDIRHLDDLAGRQVAVMQGDNAEEFLRRENRGVIIQTTPTFDIALQELSDGLHDAVVVQRLVALRLVAELDLTNLKVLDRPIDEFRQDFCFAVKEGDAQTLALLNEGLAIVIADGTYSHLHSKWFAALQLPTGRPIVVGGDHNYPPFEYLDERGRPAGYNVDLTRAIAREMGIDIEFHLGPWADIVQALEKGDIDVLQGLFYTPQRDLKIGFTQPHAVHHFVGVSRAGEAPPPTTLAELAGRRIVVQRGDAISEMLQDSGLGDQLTLVDSQEAILRELVEGRHDCGIIVRISALRLIQIHGWDQLRLSRQPFATMEYCYATQNDQRALLAQFSEGLKVLERSGEYHAIHDKWLGVYRESHPPPFLVALRYSAMVLVPLLLILLAGALWSWSLRRQVGEKTRQLRESLDQFQYVFESANVGKSLTLPSGEINANQAYADYLGYNREELHGKTWQDLTPPEDVPEIEAKLAPLLRGDQDATRFEKRYVRKDGARVWADVSTRLRRDAQGRPLNFITTVVDVTERKRAEAELADEAGRRRLLMEQSRDGIVTLDEDGQVVESNRKFAEMLGYPLESMVQLNVRDWEFNAPPEHLIEMLRSVDEKGDQFETRHRRRDGSLYDVEISTNAAWFAGQKRILCICRDITERKQLETERQKFVMLADSSSEFIGMCDLNLQPIYVNSAGIRMVGLPDMAKACQVKVQDYFFPEDQPFIAEEFFPHVMREGHGDVEIRLRHFQTGEPIWTLYYLFTIRDSSGAPIGWATVSRDITERKQAEQERERLQSQLIQAQKMESVGRLAGGVAHDFNNILQTMLGYSEMLLDTLPPQGDNHAFASEIAHGVDRASALTRQLLAFARKQTIRPVALDFNATVEGMLKMLRRLIGEDIDLAWLPESGLWTVKMDAGQIDQLLANLCVNARDAIGGVGRVTIETDNVTLSDAYCAEHVGYVPGDFVMLAVSDDGCGMDRETREQIFEPFFTTKGVHEGTGLGLATVYGIVKQNNGFINVYSEPGQGTTFKIYLPRHEGELVEKVERRKAPIPTGRGETVVMVEDDLTILSLATRMLNGLGYEVFATATPSEALQFARDREGKVHLLVTDVVMPGMNGRELSDQLRALCPNLRTLYMSGYTANVIAHRGVLEEGVHFIHKPFTIEGLAAKVREALEAKG